MDYVLPIGLAALIVLLLIPFFMKVPENKKQVGIFNKMLKPGNFRYTIFIPDSYSKNVPAPLVMVLHYAGHGAPYYGEHILEDMVKPAFSDLKAIIVSPDCPYQDWVQPKSEELILNLLDYIQSQYNVDKKRIILMGYSMGGVGTWHMAAKYPDRFSVAIPMASQPPDEALTTDWRIPFYVIHGRKDERFPVTQTSKIVAELEEKGVDISYRILENVTHYESFYFIAALQNAVPWLREKWGNHG